MHDNGTTLSARELLRREYGSSRNPMTPRLIAIGKLGRDAAYELAGGEGIEPGTRIYGVSVVRVVDGKTERDHNSSDCFSSLQAANEHIERLRSVPRCTTCGRQADNGYVNERAGERCVDRSHDPYTAAGAAARQARRAWQKTADQLELVEA